MKECSAVHEGVYVCIPYLCVCVCVEGGAMNVRMGAIHIRSCQDDRSMLFSHFFTSTFAFSLHLLF